MPQLQYEDTSRGLLLRKSHPGALNTREHPKVRMNSHPLILKLTTHPRLGLGDPASHTSHQAFRPVDCVEL